MGKTEGPPTGFIPIFSRLKSRTNPLAKVVDFERLGALLVGPGAPDPDLAPSHTTVGKLIYLSVSNLSIL